MACNSGFGEAANGSSVLQALPSQGFVIERCEDGLQSLLRQGSIWQQTLLLLWNIQNNHLPIMAVRLIKTQTLHAALAQPTTFPAPTTPAVPHTPPPTRGVSSSSRQKSFTAAAALPSMSPSSTRRLTDPAALALAASALVTFSSSGPSASTAAWFSSMTTKKGELLISDRVPGCKMLKAWGAHGNFAPVGSMARAVRPLALTTLCSASKIIKVGKLVTP